MITSYSDFPVVPKENSPGIFLAGPTPRSQEVESWRPKALEALGSLGYEGVVYVPEFSSGIMKPNYQDQVEWELQALEIADIIVFWVPRNLETMPGFTTNVEFGYWINSGKILYGRPEGSPKMSYLDYLYRTKSNKEPHIYLEPLLRDAFDKVS